MTDELIKQNAEQYAINGNTRGSLSLEILFQNSRDAYIAGAHSRDEEIAGYQMQINMTADALQQCVDELEQLRNPWISVEERLPDQKIGLCLTLIYDLDILTMKHYKKPRVSLNVYKGNNTWDKGTKTEVRYWMPIPKVKK